MRPRAFVLLHCLAVFFAALVLLAPRPAAAAGSVTLTDSRPKEDDGKWKLKMTLNYGGTPPTAHIPMTFSFTPVVLYERTLTDQSPSTPVLTKLPLHNQEPIVKSMDVGFSDPSGKLYTTTKFDFVIRRDHGFEAGEYTLVIRRSDGTQMGGQIRLTLQGDNPVVDRRAIVFTGKKAEKKPDNAAASTDKKDDPPADPPASDPPADPPASDPPVETPPEVQPKQGGCGCRVADPSPPSTLALLGVAAALGLAARRRRVRRS